MSTELTNRQQKWETLISETIKKRDLYGRSFTAGVALSILATEGWLEEDMANELDIAVIDEIARELEGDNEEDY